MSFIRRPILFTAKNIRGFKTTQCQNSHREAIVENIVKFKRVAHAQSEAELASAIKPIKIDLKALPAELEGTGAEVYLKAPAAVYIKRFIYFFIYLFFKNLSYSLQLK